MPHGERYAASMKLKTPRSDLLTFGFMARDYKKDHSALPEMMLLQQVEQLGLPQIDETPPESDPLLDLEHLLMDSANQS